jgi:hypothetical protein
MVASKPNHLTIMSTPVINLSGNEPRRNRSLPPIDVSSSAPPKLPASSSPVDVVPRMIIRSLRLELGKFVLSDAKRLLQRNLPHADILQAMMARIRSTCIGLPGRVLSFAPIRGHPGNVG